MEQQEPNEVDNASQCLSDCIEVFQKYQLTKEEMLVIFSNLGYSIGASIQGYKDTGPSQEEVMKMPSMHPEIPGMAHPDTVGVALMQVSVTVANWAWMVGQEEQGE